MPDVLIPPIPADQAAQMAEAVAEIRARMAQAAAAAGRAPGDVLLCAACKTRTVAEVYQSAALPIDLFGENHVQELVKNHDAGAYAGKPGHFIGHLQTNKVNKVVGRAALIQSVDSTRLLDKIELAATAAGLVQDILVEVNIGAEGSKTGIAPESLWPLLEAAAPKGHIRLRGLMAIPPATATERETQAFFARMRALLAEAAARYPAAPMDTLSMGMSGDYLAAIREGATLVRIGTAIYGARDYSKR
ncbi:MAG: YggS family pyridoxal phosphate-dependent enzyme [Gemmiger sp.]|nr:YggS family pyridoxal phosphate-dependent enzyme [Gemmiger sp.]